MTRRRLKEGGVFATRPKSREQTVSVFAKKPKLNFVEFAKPILQFTQKRQTATNAVFSKRRAQKNTVGAVLCEKSSLSFSFSCSCRVRAVPLRVTFAFVQLQGAGCNARKNRHSGFLRGLFCPRGYFAGVWAILTNLSKQRLLPFGKTNSRPS